MCSQSLQNFINYPARNVLTITSRFYQLSGPKCAHNYFKISTIIRPEMCSQSLQDFNNYPARDVFTISSKILGQVQPEICSQLLQDSINYPARNVLTITSTFYQLSGPKCARNYFKILGQIQPEMCSQSLQISTIIRPEMCSQLLQDFRSDPARNLLTIISRF